MLFATPALATGASVTIKFGKFVTLLAMREISHLFFSD
jgi:hypothetical protein